jgi:hypothetical protein
MRRQSTQFGAGPRRAPTAVPEKGVIHWRRRLGTLTRRRPGAPAGELNLRAGAQAPPRLPFQPRF